MIHFESLGNLVMTPLWLACSFKCLNSSCVDAKRYQTQVCCVISNMKPNEIPSEIHNWYLNNLTRFCTVAKCLQYNTEILHYERYFFIQSIVMLWTTTRPNTLTPIRKIILRKDWLMDIMLKGSLKSAISFPIWQKVL